MPQYAVAMILGGMFILLGTGSYFWGKSEEKDYYTRIVTRRRDLREFLDHTPLRPEPPALKVGGWIAIIVGCFLLVLGGFWLWG